MGFVEAHFTDRIFCNNQTHGIARSERRCQITMSHVLHRTGQLSISTLALAALISCGGGGTDEAPPAADQRKSPQAVFTPTGTIPADANVKGMFSPVTPWPLIPVHTVLMADGRVITYGTDGTGKQTGNFIYDVWDPEGGLNGGHTTIANTTATDIFCSSQVMLPAGNAVFVAGGDNWTGTATTNTGNNNSNLFTLATNTLARGPNMNRPRWYSSSTTLINGDTYIQGGSGGTDRPEVRQADGVFRLLSSTDTSALSFDFPRNFVAADGRVFGYDSAGKMYYVDANGTGSITMVGQLPSANTGGDASAAMFRPGRILQMGGNSNGAVVIDIRNGTPSVTATASMSSQRRLVNASILPDGKVLATGGSSTWNELTNVNYQAEIWNPDTGTWTIGATYQQAKLYHSQSLLLPDGTVMVGGGGAPGPQNNLNFELYYPPYLFKAGGLLAERPVITAAPTVLDIGKTFTVDTSGPNAAARVVLIKSGSVTHSFNMEQRFVELTFNQNGGRLNVQAPTRAGDAPPGFYMLFVLDANGVPSVAKILRINVAATPNPATVPTLANPGDQAALVGGATSLQLAGSDPNGDTLSYAATGLPPGLAIDPATGRISGTPTANGNYNVVASVSDGVNGASTNFVWSVTGSTAFSVSTAQPAATTAGSTVAFTASSANGVNVQYKWSFGDGSPDTAYSASPATSHTYAQPGLYYVTVTAIDDSGLPVARTVLQQIYLPTLAGKPNASSPIAYTQPASGNARLWVVNPDNDTVSVFDAVTRAKIAEIAVGSAPRTLAVASTGMLWVANKGSASISVIDPATNTVSRTIALARGSQPYGIAMAGSNALVVLEAGGSLLKFSATSYAQTGSLAIGAKARHVSVNAAGTQAFVTRFITPPLPGESTAAVQTPANVGGEVLAVDTAAMSLLRTMILAHGDRADAENQGRGIPNYLGAAAFSPDGSVAWVPSKQDNVKRGLLRDGLALNFQNTVRAISSRIDLATNSADTAQRLDHDNASMASAASFDPKGSYLFVALETSREVAIVDAHGRREIMRIDTGRAPQGVAVSADGLTLYVHNFMDRTVGAYDLRPLVQQGLLSAPLLGTMQSVATEKLAANVLVGKQHFYDARDTRLARDRYMSCAACHNDGGHDGRVWDLTGFGEGLRNTINLRGRAGMGQGFLHWSNNFDEVQDFEGQIRNLAGGTGLMSDAAFTAGTRSQPLGDKKAGLSTDLDALAAYVGSLASFEPSPARPSATTLSTAATTGKAIFAARSCGSCHAGTAFSGSGANTLVNIGTVKATSGQRLGAPLTGIDVPTLRDVWATAPYLHDGSAATLELAVRAHNGTTISDTDLANLAQYLREIGSDEAAPAVPAGPGSGLTGAYFNNVGLTGSATFFRNEAVDFDWGTGAPGTGVAADNFSVRWSGSVVAPATGSYRFQTSSDDGVRLWVNGALVIDNWTDHAPTDDTSATVNLVAGQSASIVAEYYERGGGAVMRLRWQTPGEAAFVAIPADRLVPSQTIGSGLVGSYFNNVSLTGAAALTRTEAVNFSWGTASPGTGVNADNFSARWTGTVLAATTGTYRFQTVSDDGVRLWVNGTQVINNWTDHGTTTNTSGTISLVAGQRYAIRLEYYEHTGGATMQLRWQPPNTTSYVAIPAASLFTN